MPLTDREKVLVKILNKPLQIQPDDSCPIKKEIAHTHFLNMAKSEHWDLVNDSKTHKQFPNKIIDTNDI